MAALMLRRESLQGFDVYCSYNCAAGCVLLLIVGCLHSQGPPWQGVELAGSSTMRKWFPAQFT